MPDYLNIFGYLKIQEAYQSYFAIIDFFIYLMVFMGLAKIVFAKHFEGREGEWLSTGVGLALAVGMIVMEIKLGFNIGAMGGVAAAILVVVFALLFFFILNGLDLEKTTSLTWTFIICYVLLQVTVPQLHDWLFFNFPFIDLIFIFACLYAVVKLILSWGKDSSITGPLEKMSKKSFDKNRFSPLAEEQLEGRGMKVERGLIGYERNVSSQIGEQLRELENLVQQSRVTDNDEMLRKEILQKVGEIIQKERDLLQKLRSMETLYRDLEALNVRVLRKLDNEYRETRKKDRAKIIEQIRVEKSKFQVNHQMKDLINRIKENIAGLNACVKSCIESLANEDGYGSKTYLDKAIKYQMEINIIFEKMEQMTSAMDSLTEQEAKGMRKDFKKAS